MESKISDVLSTRYSIIEPVVAAGNFVPAPGSNVPPPLTAPEGRTTCPLTAIIVTDASLIIARVCWSSDDIDYEVISVRPLSLLTLGVESYQEKQIFVKIHFKPLKVFQLCSSEDMEAVWERFVNGLEGLKDKSRGDGWMAPYLDPAFSHGIYRHQPGRLRRWSFPMDTLPCSHGCTPLFESSPAVLQICSRPESLTSLPEMVSPALEQNNPNMSFNNLNCLNIKFDSFVNEGAPSRDNISVSGIDLNTDDCPSESVKAKVDEAVPVVDEKPCWIVRVFRGIFKCKSKDRK